MTGAQTHTSRDKGGWGNEILINEDTLLNQIGKKNVK